MEHTTTINEQTGHQDCSFQHQQEVHCLLLHLLAGDGQHVVLHLDLDAVLRHAGELSLDHIRLLRLAHVAAGRPVHQRRPVGALAAATDLLLVALLALLFLLLLTVLVRSVAEQSVHQNGARHIKGQISLLLLFNAICKGQRIFWRQNSSFKANRLAWKRHLFKHKIRYLRL